MAGNRINILYLSHLSELHGAEQVLLLLLENMDKAVFNPVVALPESGLLKRRLDILGIQTCVVSMRPWICPSGVSNGRFIYSLGSNLKKNIEELTDIIRKEKIDIVHTNTSTIVDGAFAAALAGVPHIWHVHEMLKGNPSFKHIIGLEKVYETISNLSHKIVSVSKSVDQQFEKTDKGKREVIHNGIDTHVFAKQSKGNLREEWGVNQSISLVLAIGAVVKEKGYEYLIDAVPGIVSQCGEVHFAIVGPIVDSSLYDALKKRIRRRRVREYFTFLGYREDIPQILQDADLVVMPSIKEAFPLSLLEAMAAGKPVVATRCGGTEEIVTDGETGYLVQCRAPDALADAVLKVLKDRDMAGRMGERGKKRVRAEFGLESFVRRWESLYKEVFADKSAVLPDRESVEDVALHLLETSAEIGLDLASKNEQLEGFERRTKDTLVYKLHKLLRIGHG